MAPLTQNALALTDGPARALAGMLLVSRFCERLLLLGAVLSFARDDVRVGAASSFAVAVLATSRGIIRSPLLARVRRTFATRVAAAVFIPGALQALRDPAGGKETGGANDVVIFDGLWANELFVSSFAPGLVADCLAAIVVALVVGPRLPGSFLATAAILFVLVAATAEGLRRLASRASQRGYEAFVPFATLLEEIFIGVDELRTNGRRAPIQAALQRHADRWTHETVRADWLAGFAGRAPYAVGFVGLVGALVVHRSGQGVPTSRALAEAMLAASALPPFAGIAQSLVGLAQEAPKAARLAALLAIPTPTGGTTRATLPAPVRADDLSFRYAPDRAPVLAHLSFVWEPGQLLAIAGPNGAGKSTLLALLGGMLATEGAASEAISIGAIPLAAMDRDELSGRTCFVSQTPFFARDATVRSALALFVERSDAEIEAALRQLGLWERLSERAPEDPLAVSVEALSVGERQRISLARAVLARPALAFFDEPDASLDEEGQKLLPGFLRRLSDEGTMVAFVAHRPTVIACADQVLHLRAGAGDTIARS